MANGRVRLAVILTVLWLFAVHGSGHSLMRENVLKHVEPGTRHAFLNFCLTFQWLLLLTLLYHRSSCYCRDRLNMLWKLTVCSLLIGSTMAWRIPSMKSLKSLENFGTTKEQSGSLTCTENRCEMEVDVHGKLLLKTGHSLKFTLKDKDTGVSVNGRIYVKQSETIMGYAPDLYMPAYDLAHRHMFDNEDNYNDYSTDLDDGNELRRQLSVGVGKVYMGGVKGKKHFINYVSEKTLGNLADKFKCGRVFKSDVKNKQFYTIQPHANIGHVLYKPTGESGLNVTICVDIGGESCSSTFIRGDEDIYIEHDTLRIRLARNVRPRKPTSPPLLAFYDGRDKEHRLSEWRVSSYDMRGQTSYGTIGAVQSSCLFDGLNSCGFAHFRFEDVVDWTMQDWRACSPEKSMSVRTNDTQQGVVTVLIVSLIVAALIVGGAIGATELENSCHHCSVTMKGIVGPTAQKQFAKQFTPIEKIYSNIHKELPSSAKVIEKDGNKYLNDMFMRYNDFEDSHIELSASGKGIEIDIPEDTGEIVDWNVKECTVNIAGGVSTCLLEIDYNGPDKEEHVYSKSDETVVLTDGINIHQGLNVIDIGVETITGERKLKGICLGRVRDQNCKDAMKVNIMTDERVVNLIDSNDTDDSGSSTGAWNFKGFWDSLTEWWEKMIAVVVWVIGLLCGIILLIVLIKVFKKILFLCAFKKDVYAEMILVKPVTINEQNRSRNMSIKIMTSIAKTESEAKKLYIPAGSKISVYKYKNHSKDRGDVDKIKDIDGVLFDPYTVDRRQIIYAKGAKMLFDKKNVTVIWGKESPIVTFRGVGLGCKSPDTECLEPELHKIEDENVMNIKGTSCNGFFAPLKVDYHDCPKCPPPDSRYNNNPDSHETTVWLRPHCITMKDLTGEGVVQITERIGDFSHQEVDVQIINNCKANPFDDKIWGGADCHTVTIGDLKGTTNDLYGLDQVTNDVGEFMEKVKTEMGDTWFNGLVLIDHMDRDGSVKIRSGAIGQYIFFMDNGQGPDETVTIMPIAFFPWTNQRYSAINLVLRIVNPPESGLEFNDETAIEFMKQAYKIDCRQFKEQKLRKNRWNIWLEIEGLGCEFVSPQTGKKIKVQKSIILRENRAIMHGTDKECKSSTGGLMVTNCLCFDKEVALCMRNESIALIDANCTKNEPLDGSELYMYNGGYTIGDENAELHFVEGNVIAHGDFVYTDDGGYNFKVVKDGSSYKGNGMIEHLMKDKMEPYVMWVEERNCDGMTKLRCLEKDYRGVFWLSIGLPLVFILLIVFFKLLQFFLAVGVKRRLKQGFNYVNKTADTIIAMPTGSKSNGKTGSAVGDFFKRRR